ncbi:hypothetical protein GCM10022289_21660 [Pedobacter jeongneungensis]|uniref:Helix-turn-helix domain-containing protein n=1 Tax=Pedobacter jeongneungensis TaxID=947309 RepID=A0ABP8BDC5_9SPHI
MQLFDSNVLIQCIKDAVRDEMKIQFGDMNDILLAEKEKGNERLFTKKEMANELDISLVSLTDWMKRGIIPYLRLGKRIYFRKSEVINVMVIRSKNEGEHGK